MALLPPRPRGTPPPERETENVYPAKGPPRLNQGGPPGGLKAVPRGPWPGPGPAPSGWGGTGGSGNAGGGSTTTKTRIPVSPFLTPEQQRRLNDYDTAYKYSVAGLNRKLLDSTANTRLKLADLVKGKVVGEDRTDQVTAARGIFQSSIRDGELNDIEATFTMRTNILNTNLQRLALDINSTIERLGTEWANTHNFYNQLAVQNATNAPPSYETTTTPTPQPQHPAPAGGARSANTGQPVGTIGPGTAWGTTGIATVAGAPPSVVVTPGGTQPLWGTTGIHAVATAPPGTVVTPPVTPFPEHATETVVPPRGVISR